MKRINRRKLFLKGTIERYEFNIRFYRKRFDISVRNLRERNKDIVADLIVTWFAAKSSQHKVERFNRKVWTKEELGVK